MTNTELRLMCVLGADWECAELAEARKEFRARVWSTEDILRQEG